MPLTTLPFTLHATLPARLGDAPLHVLAVAANEDDEPPTAADWPATAEVISLFCEAVRRALLGPTSGPVVEVSRTWDADLPGWRFELTMPGLPAGALRVLCALLTQTHHAYEPLARLELITATATASPLPDDAPGWPPAPPTLPFAFDPADPDAWPFPGEAYSLAFDFVAPPAAALLDEVSEALNVWDHLRILGGFNQDFAEVEESEDFGQIVRETPARLRVDARRVTADPCDIHALLQLADATHRAGQALRGVTLEI